MIYNDPVFIKCFMAVLVRRFGKEDVVEGRPQMVAEDFGELGKAAGAPSVMIRIGAVEPKQYAAATAARTPLPSLHSAMFAPDRERTIRTATAALVLSTLELLRPR